MADGQQIEGLPEGAQVRPLGGSPHEEIQGLPEGAEVRPLNGGSSSEQTQQVSGPSKTGAAIPAFNIPVDQRNAPGRSQADYDIRQAGEAQRNWRDPGYQFNRITHNSPTPFTDVAMAMYPAAGIGEEAATQGIKTVAKNAGRGLLKSAAGAGVGGGVGAGVGSIFGHPQEGAQIGATVGGVGAPFAPNAWFSRAPYGMNRVILGEEGLADAKAASKMAQREADVRAGLRSSVGPAAKRVPPPPLSGKFASRFNEPELPSKAPIPPLAGPNRNTPAELPSKAPIPPPGPVNRMGEELPSRAPIPPLGKPISRFNAPEEEGSGVVLTDAERGSGASETPAVTTSGKRPTGTEAFLTNLVKKPIWTPEDMADIRNAFGQDGVMRPGEGQTQYRARLTGMIRSSRAAQGMADIESYPAPRGRR